MPFDYSFAMQQVVRIRKAVICVFTDDRAILHRNKQDKIGLPGGKLNPVMIHGQFSRWETPEESVLREFYEETGIPVRFVKDFRDTSIGKNGSYPLFIMETTVLNNDTVLFVTKWLSSKRVDTDAWKHSAKAKHETSGIYAAKASDILAYNGKSHTPLLHGGNSHPDGTLVRHCAIGSILFIQNSIRKFKLL